MIYLTFNDNPSGVFKSQVVDVIKYLNFIGNTKFLLISFIPRQNFLKNRKIIKTWYRHSIIVPILPGLRFWKIQKIIFRVLNLFFKSSKIIARGPIASFIALKNKTTSQKIIYDARASVKDEINEYGYLKNDLANRVIEMEYYAVQNADYRIAVSNKLIDVWISDLDYKSNNHVVIPCTAENIDEESKIKDAFFNTESPVLVYSGSTSPWQSFPLLTKKVDYWLSNSNGKVLFLCKDNELLNNLIVKYPNRVKRMFVPENKVHSYLSKCDYGLLIREKMVTNKVASPVKFAEYLRAGLKVVISKNIGDYSSFVEKFNLGFSNDDKESLNEDLAKITEKDRNSCKEYFAKNLSLDSQKDKYQLLLNL
jgi:hypothetical protein